MGMKGEEAYVLSNSSTKKALDGLGALKGAPATIESIKDVEGGHQITFAWIGTSGNKETDSIVVKDGTPGQNGVSPSIAISDIAGGHHLLVTDASGEHEFDVMDGVKGDPLTFDDLTEEQKDELKGRPGKDGNDGVSPLITVTEAGGKHTITILDKSGTQQFTVVDGTEVDLSDYNTKDEVAALLRNKADVDDIPTVPTNISQLTNDSQYIKNTVDNLINYYTKQETYSQDEINTIISNMNKLTAVIVTELPTENISTSTIYLIAVEDQENVYMQYMYINNAFATLGTTAIDLSNVYTKAEVDSKLNDKADKDSIPTVPTKVSEFVNDAGYLSSFTEQDPTVPEWAKQPQKPTYTASEVHALPDDTQIPVFPNKEVLDKFTEDTSGNVMYDGKKIGSDSSSADVNISAEDGNAIIEKSDGLYVEDKTEAISKVNTAVDDLNKKVKSINYAQHTVNEEIQHGELKLTDPYTPVTGEYIPFKLKEGNLVCDDQNHSVKLLAGRTYSISICMSYYSAAKTYASISYSLVNITTNEAIQTFQPYRGDQMYEQSYSMTLQYTPEADCEVVWRVGNVYSSDTISPGLTIWTVQEISRHIVVDLVDHVNSKSGIEDTPVGSIVHHVGLTPPTHYLACDGSIYNIADYPYLAEHIKKDFGKYNAFGGDGETTFAVPYMPEQAKQTEIVMTSNTTPEPYVVSASSVYNSQYVDWYAFTSEIGAHNRCWVAQHMTEDTWTPQWLQIDLGESISISSILLAPRYDYPLESPSDFQLQGSNDGQTFTTIKKFTGLTVSDWIAGEYKRFDLDSLVNYRYYRVYIEQICGSYDGTDKLDASIGDWQFITVPESRHFIKYEPTYFMKNVYDVHDIYSTEEKVVGRWIDGKPVYKTTVKVELPTSSNAGNESIKNYDFDANIDIVVDMTAVYNLDRTSNCIAWNNYTSDSQYRCGVYYDKSIKAIVLNNTMPAWNGTDVYVHMMYTKTTDTPYTDTMSLDIEYTDEEVAAAVANVLK